VRPAQNIAAVNGASDVCGKKLERDLAMQLCIFG
jgi:hypothetical protein